MNWGYTKVLSIEAHKSKDLTGA